MIDKRSKKTIVLGVKEQGLYRLHDDVAESHALIANSRSIDNSSLWHQRYRHFNFLSPSVLTKCRMMHGLPNISSRYM
jgi:hypothetical protein